MRTKRAKKKMPAFQFYPGDWLKDTSLRCCSPAARGVWMDIICIAFDSNLPGILRKNGQKIDEKMLKTLIPGCTPKMIQELIENGVLAKSSRTGTLYCKRLLRDYLTRRRLSRFAGKGGNPRLKRVNPRVGGRDNPTSNPTPNPTPNPKVGSSSSSSSSASTNKKNIEIPDALKPYEKHVRLWLEYKRERNSTYLPIGLKALFKKMIRFGPRLPQIVEGCIGNNWQGLHECNNGSVKPKNNKPKERTEQEGFSFDGS